MKLLIKLLIAGGAVSAPAFTVTMTALSNASGVVTTLAYINGGGGGGGAYADLIIAIAAAKAGATFTAQGSTINVSAIPNRTSGVAPMGVFIDCAATTAPGITSNPFHDLYYVTFFDDDNTATFSRGTQPGVAKKNVGIGPEVGHVFETARTCNTKTTAFHLSSDGLTLSIGATVVNTVTASAPSGANTIAVANGAAPTAGVGGVPAGATCVGSIATIEAAMALVTTTGKRVILDAASTFGMSSPVNINHSGTVLGKFGTGKPTVNMSAGSYFGHGANVDGLTLMDLNIAGGATGQRLLVTGVGALTDPPTRKNFLLLRVDANQTSGVNGMFTSGFFVQDSNITNCTGGGGNVGIYSEWSDHVAILGTQVNDCTGVEHCIRFQGNFKAIISNNDAVLPAANKHAITVRGRANYADETIWSGTWAEHIVVSDNVADAGTAGNVPATMQVAPNSDTGFERIRDVIVERNYVTGWGSTHLSIEVENRISVRNNIFNWLTQIQYPDSTIQVMARNLSGVLAGDSIWIYNNSTYAPTLGAYKKFCFVSLMKYGGLLDWPTNVGMKNNLVYAPDALTDPSLGSQFFLRTAAPGSYWTIANCPTDAQVRTQAPGFTIPPVTYTDWKPTSGIAIDGGTPVPVFDDFFGAARTGTYDMGAVNP